MSPIHADPPKNTEKELYILGGTHTLAELLERAKAHFGPDFDPQFCTVEAEHYHARCLGYDLYDSSDYDDYTRLDYDPPAKLASTPCTTNNELLTMFNEAEVGGDFSLKVAKEGDVCVVCGAKLNPGHTYRIALDDSFCCLTACLAARNAQLEARQQEQYDRAAEEAAYDYQRRLQETMDEC